MTKLFFNDAIRVAATIAADPSLPSQWPVRVVRDVFGRVRFAVDCNESDYPVEAREHLEHGLESLGLYATKKSVMFRNDFSNPKAVFESVDWHGTTVDVSGGDDGESDGEITIPVLDRQIVGQDWLSAQPDEAKRAHPYRVVFYGLKGGVGRSTALAMVAYGLAMEGKRVLLLDFDLESPGLSGLLLSPERVAERGIVDWFIEDGIGQGDAVLPDMISDSQLAETTTGSIRVAAAMGQNEEAYLSKLARIYGDVPSLDGPERFAGRMHRLVQVLEEAEQPDVVLIDSRAGLHDVAAVAITSLADTALLFATDSAQNWLGYRQLFSHWQHRPKVCSQVRERLAIVQALAPKSDREGRSTAFSQRAYDLFSSTLYDEIKPATNDAVADNVKNAPFNPAMEDESAPHFPVRVDWDDVFQEFDPRVRPENGGVSNAEIDAKFGNLVNWVKSRVNGA